MASETTALPAEGNGQKEHWQIVLDRLYGSVKNIKRLTKEQRNKLAEEITEEEQEILLRRFGFL